MDSQNEDTKLVLASVKQDILRSEYIATVDSVEEFGHLIVYAVPRKYYPGTNVHPCCPYCGSPLVRNKGLDTREFSDIPVGKPTTVSLKFARYRCSNKGCGGFNTPLDEFIGPNDKITYRLKDHIYKECFKLVPYSHVAGEVGLDVGTVSSMVDKRLKEEFSHYHVEWPEVIGVDEDHFHSFEHEYAFIITDPVNIKIIDLWESRKTDFITKRFLEIPGRENVIACAMDMSRDYRSVVQDVFPNAQIVVDRFHVIKMITKAMNDIRNNIYKQHKKAVDTMNLPAPQKNKLKNKIKHDFNTLRDLMLYNQEDLGEDAQKQLGCLLKLYPELENVYNMKEAFRSIYTKTTRLDAELQYLKWCNMFPSGVSLYEPYERIKNVTMNNWYDEVFNYFSFKEKGIYISNGPTESLNGLVKSIMRVGKGYSFDVLRAKCVIGSDVRSETYIEEEIRKRKKKMLRDGVTDRELLEYEALREAVLEDEEEKKRQRNYKRKTKIAEIE